MLPLSADKTAVAVSAGVYVVNGQKVIVKIVAITRRQDWAVAQSCLFYLKNYAIKSCPMQILYQD